MKNFTLEKMQLCDIQGRLFELALKKGYDCPSFIEAFMNSRVAACLDDVYDRMQWAGEEYMLEELGDEVNGLKKAGTIFDNEVMYWSSKRIYTIADAKTMNECWQGFHALDVEMAIENLKEIYAQKQAMNI